MILYLCRVSVSVCVCVSVRACVCVLVERVFVKNFSLRSPTFKGSSVLIKFLSRLLSLKMGFNRIVVVSAIILMVVDNLSKFFSILILTSVYQSDGRGDEAS